MDLFPFPIGPLNPEVEDLLATAALFALTHFAISRLLPCINHTFEEGEDATKGTTRWAEELREQAEQKRAEAAAVLAEARHDAALTRRRAFEEGTRPDPHSPRRRPTRAGGHPRGGTRPHRIASDRVAAEARLHRHITDLASELASRVVGERITSPAEPRSRS